MTRTKRYNFDKHNQSRKQFITIRGCKIFRQTAILAAE